LRNAEAITLPIPTASASSLTVDVVDVADDPTVIDLSGTTLQITEGVGSAVDLTSSQVQVTAFTVENLTKGSTPGRLKVSITVAYNNSSGRNEYDYSQTYQTTISLR
jgi:hypothetical protein